MMKSVFVLVFAVSVLGQQEMLNRLRIRDYNPYFVQLAQETIFEVEKVGWSNFKLDDFTQTLNEITHTNLLVTGEVSYSNGFLVSVQKIDVSQISPIITHRLDEQNVTITTVSVRGHINFRHASVGYDVVANVTSDDRLRRYTGVFTHSVIQGRFEISRNMNTNEISLSALAMSAAAGSGVRMIYMPADEISEILSLRFVAMSSFGNAGRWMREIIGPIMLDVARNKIQFPEVCFNC
ncbi:hypothetical protein ABMA27_007261 [Loxostege sticticalis]|uniref:Uncharacterized protein n=1 Tax=Loxostege sticticalis TaxID=481309 RepID=A0ABR3HEX9_LOXSC